MIFVPAMASLFGIGELISRASANLSSRGTRNRRWRRRGGFNWRRILHLSKYFRRR
jgi:hypothetical protein